MRICDTLSTLIVNVIIRTGSHTQSLKGRGHALEAFAPDCPISLLVALRPAKDIVAMCLSYRSSPELPDWETLQGHN